MNALAGVTTGLQAALLLARGKPGGIGLLESAEGEPAMATARLSFWAVPLCLPAFVCLLLFDIAQGNAGPHPAHDFALQLFGYVIDWAGFALLTRWLATALGRGARWPVFIAAFNWCQVVQYLLGVATILPKLLGLPDEVFETAWHVSTGWGIWLEWYAARLALGVSPLQAIGIVLLDEALSFGLIGVIGALSGSG